MKRAKLIGSKEEIKQAEKIRGRLLPPAEMVADELSWALTSHREPPTPQEFNAINTANSLINLWQDVASAQQWLDWRNESLVGSILRAIIQSKKNGD